MNANEWRAKGRAAEEVVDLPLPSGMEIRARRPDPLQFALWDRLPLMLAVLEGAKDAATAAEEDLVGLADFMREVLVYCCVEPRISEMAAPNSQDEIKPREIHGKDLLFILAWAMRTKEAVAVRPFRTGRDVRGAGGDGENVLVQTVGAAGDRGSGPGAGGGPGGSAESLPAGQGRGRNTREQIEL